MSMTLMVDALKAKIGNPGRKLVLIKLADNANDKGECWPSYQHVADQCEMGRSTVKAHIKALAKAGFIQVTPRNDGKSSNAYLLTISKGDSNLTRSNPDPVNGEPGQETDTPRSESDPLTRSESDPRTSHSPEPVIEPDAVGVDAPAHEAPADPDHIPTDELPEHERRLFSEPGEQVGFQAVPPRQIQSEHRRKFPMHFGWEISEQFPARCQAVGVAFDRLELEQREEILGEFRSYWEARGDEYPQALWEHKLMSWIKRTACTNPHGAEDETAWIDGVEEEVL